jgi:hypothetical protein
MARSARVRLAAAAVALAALPLAPSVASANAPAVCATAASAQVFAPVADALFYIPTPGGTFEAGAPAWTLAGGASVLRGDDPWRIGGASETGLLQLPAGASAISPAACVDITMPTLRFVVRAQSAGATLRLEANQDGRGWQPVASFVAPTVGWAAPLPFDFTAALKVRQVYNNTSAVSFRLTASGGTFQVDDVFVDPFKWR